MIFLAGFVVTILAFLFFIKLKYVTSINEWILETSQFVYYSGHPVLNDDEIFDQIKKRFRGVFGSLLVVLLKTILFLSIIIALVALSSIVIRLVNGQEIPQLKSDNILSELFPKYLLELPFIMGTLLPIILVPLLAKKKAKEKVPYSDIDKLLHYIFLGNKNISHLIFKIELFFNKKNLQANLSIHNVYISGMARAGTTVLMQYLGALDEFKSLSYRNLPFLFMPKTWPKLVSNKKAEEKERYHQDGVKHSLNSYEALEEPFFRNNVGEQYIKEYKIIKHELDQNLYNKYNAFRRLLAEDKIYLAKNNNHLLRAESLHEFDEKQNNKTFTIIPFRDPYEQATSLLKQHTLLSKLQEEDTFTLDYMDFLVHHEFGLHCKIPMLIEKDVKSILNLDKNSLEYWLEIWYLFHNQVFKIFKGKRNFYFYCYENFVSDPKYSLETLLSNLNLSKELVNSIPIKKFEPKTSQSNDNIDKKYLKTANA